MKKIMFLIFSIIMCFNNKTSYDKTYSYCGKEILDRDNTWIKEIKKEELEVEKVEKVEKVESVLDVFTGKMSGYGPDCGGCSGYLAYQGIDVRDGNIYYSDYEYGILRIVAGDRQIPFGSIIEVNDAFKAIVLDRGGAIGFNKNFLFDLLYEDERTANEKGILVDAKFEVLRYGF